MILKLNAGVVKSGRISGCQPDDPGSNPGRFTKIYKYMTNNSDDNLNDSSRKELIEKIRQMKIDSEILEEYLAEILKEEIEKEFKNSKPR